MPLDVLVLDRSAPFVVLQTDFEKVAQTPPLDPGRSYLVLAKGNVNVLAGGITLRLEIHGLADETTFTHTAGAHPFEVGHTSFTLAVAVTVPPDPGPDPDLFVPAMFFARRSSSGGLGEINSVKVIVLPLDSLSIVAA